MIARPRPDLFGRVPSRFRDALKRGEITFEQFALGAYLALECYLEGGTAIFTLVALKEELHYPKSRDSLRRDLSALRPDWIDFQVAERQRRPYLIRPTGLAVRDETATAAASPDRVLQSPPSRTQSPPQSRPATDPQQEPKTPAPATERRRSDSSSDPFLSRLLSFEEEVVKQRHEEEALQQRPPWELHRQTHPHLHRQDGDRLLESEDEK